MKAFNPISWRPPDGIRRKIDELANAHDCTRSEMITRMIGEAMGMPQYRDYKESKKSGKDC